MSEYLKEHVPFAFFKDHSASKRRDSVKPGDLSRERRRLKDQTIDRDMHRSLQPNEINSKDKSDPSEYLSTYSRLLRAGRYHLSFSFNLFLWIMFYFTPWIIHEQITCFYS